MVYLNWCIYLNDIFVLELEYNRLYKKRKQLTEKDSNKQIHRQIKIFCWGEQCY